MSQPLGACVQDIALISVNIILLSDGLKYFLLRRKALNGVERINEDPVLSCQLYPFDVKKSDLLSDYLTTSSNSKIVRQVSL